MGKTRDLFKKTGEIKGIFTIRMGLIKDRNGQDLTEAEKIKKRWPEYIDQIRSDQLFSRVQLCDPMDSSTPCFPVHHYLPRIAQTQVH